MARWRPKGCLQVVLAQTKSLELVMEYNEMARLYNDAVKNLTSAAGAWAKETRAVEEVLSRAARRSEEEARAVFGTVNGTPDIASVVRFGDLARAQVFLWAVVGLAAGERLGRTTSGALPGFAALAPSPRAFVLGAVAI